MTASELQDWLGKEESAGAGWDNDDGSGETIGHESGRKIIAILEKNPNKDPSKYDDEDIDHMRRVVACMCSFLLSISWRLIVLTMMF